VRASPTEATATRGNVEEAHHHIACFPLSNQQETAANIWRPEWAWVKSDE